MPKNCMHCNLMSPHQCKMVSLKTAYSTIVFAVVISLIKTDQFWPRPILVLFVGFCCCCCCSFSTKTYTFKSCRSKYWLLKIRVETLTLLFLHTHCKPHSTLDFSSCFCLTMWQWYNCMIRHRTQVSCIWRVENWKCFQIWLVFLQICLSSVLNYVTWYISHESQTSLLNIYKESLF